MCFLKLRIELFYIYYLEEIRSLQDQAPVHDDELCSKSIALRFFNLVTRWSLNGQFHPPRKASTYPLHRDLDVPQSLSGIGSEEKNISLIPAIEPQFFSLSLRSLIISVIHASSVREYSAHSTISDVLIEFQLVHCMKNTIFLIRVFRVQLNVSEKYINSIFMVEI